VSAGFVEFEITWRADVFADAPQASSAAAFGTKGINFRARKPRNSEEWETALQALLCEVPKWPDLMGLEDV
jgi:hypothetical protein